MARRKRKVLRAVKKTLPKIFRCPQCGMISVIINKKDKGYNIVCGECGLKYEINQTTLNEIDVFNQFIDKFNRGELS